MSTITTSSLPDTVERRELPPLPEPTPLPVNGGVLTIDRFDTYAVIRCGEMYAEIERFAYWDEKYYTGHPPEIWMEARIYTPRDHGGAFMS